MQAEDQGSTQARVSEGVPTRSAASVQGGSKSCVYRCFDRDGRLLYIGCSQRVIRRWFNEHSRDKAWHGEVETMTFEWRTSAEAPLPTLKNKP